MGLQPNVIRTGVQISQIIRKVAAGDLYSDPVPSLKDVPSSPPEMDGVFVDPVRLNLA